MFIRGSTSLSYTSWSSDTAYAYRIESNDLSVGWINDGKDADEEGSKGRFNLQSSD